jgi:GNAT superfamily N-acetyltransferase
VIEVDNLVVRADQRGRKIGRRLLAAAVEWSRQRRATHVEVTVHDFNRDAKRFYENFGFLPSVGRMVLAA